MIENAAGEALALALAEKGFAIEMRQPIITDVNRAALEVAYRRKFSKAPASFENLLAIYEAGRLPCGWDGDLKHWPSGMVMVY